MWLTMPITRPSMSNSGPPELPLLIAASVCRNSTGTPPVNAPLSLRRALRWPLVRLW